MGQKKHRPEEIVAQLRQVDVLLSQSRPVAEAIRTISVTPFTYYRWRKEFGGLKSDQVKRLKDLEKENERLRKAVSDLTLEKLILKEAAISETGKPSPPSPLHRPYCSEVRCVGAAGVPGSGAAPIDAAQGVEGASRRCGVDGRHHRVGETVWTLRLSPWPTGDCLQSPIGVGSRPCCGMPDGWST